jgi:hypothetical protein
MIKTTNKIIEKMNEIGDDLIKFLIIFLLYYSADCGLLLI